MKKALQSVVFFSLISFASVVPALAEKGDVVPAPNVIPPVTEAMQHPEYWISRINGDPDRVIMTPGQITALNEKNRSRPMDTTDMNGNPYSIRDIVDRKDIIGIQFHLEDPLTMRSFLGDSLRVRFKRARDYWLNGAYWDRRALPWTEERKNELVDATDEASIPDLVLPRYGLLVRHTLNRVIPTDEAAFGRQFSTADMLQSTSLETGMPVAILHASKNSEWLYVKTELSFGWVPAVNVAEGSIKRIRHFAEPDDFVVSIAHNVSVYSDSDFRIHLTDIYLGARLMLVKKNDDGYRVLVPFRLKDGALDAVIGWIRLDAPVSVGYQPFTQRNVLETMFRLLYRPYGWADMCHERDCCGTVRVVLKTFGIITPRWTTHELHSADHVMIFPRGTPKEVKYRYLDTCEPGITLCGFTGHIVMYLGKADGSYFVIHQNGYSYYDNEGTEFRIGRVIVNDTELDGGSNIERFTEISTFKP